MKTQNAITSTSQEFLDIFDITNDLVILKNGGASVILTVTAMNFGLLAEEEQDAIIYGYAGLLNSLNYPIQIVIRSQTKDITGYLRLLEQKQEETLNHVRKEQIRRYREFVADLVQERNVLDKKFYVVIPATALELGLITTQSMMPGVKSPDISTFDRSLIVERAKNLLEPKRDHIIAQFGRIGLYSRQLKTQEIIQLFYTAYNTEAADGQKMTDSRQYTSPVIDSSGETLLTPNNRTQVPANLKSGTFTPPAPTPASPAPETTQMNTAEMPSSNVPNFSVPQQTSQQIDEQFSAVTPSMGNSFSPSAAPTLDPAVAATPEATAETNQSFIQNTYFSGVSSASNVAQETAINSITNPNETMVTETNEVSPTPALSSDQPLPPPAEIV
jgi:hypothetical protein